MELGDELIVRKPREGYKKKDERDEIRLFGINDLDAKSDQEAFRASLDAIRASVEDLTIPSLVPKLEAESSWDRVGGAGGLRIYVPARMAKDSQFPFRPGDLSRIAVVLDFQRKPAGVLLAKRGFLEELRNRTKMWEEKVHEPLTGILSPRQFDPSAGEVIVNLGSNSAEDVIRTIVSLILRTAPEQIRVKQNG